MNVALITARGGSKGLPRKNVLPLAGKPLIAWTIEAALAAECIDKVYVSTDNDEIAAISRDFGATVIARPAELAQDNSGSEPVIAHAIAYLQAGGDNVEQVFLLQPTSPLRNAAHINAAWQQYCQHQAKCLISVFEPKHTPAKAYKINADGTLSGLLSDSAPYTRRQDLPTAVQPNGAIYLFSAAAFMQHQQIPRHNVVPFMMNHNDSVDIDSAEDLALAATLMENRYE
ncbi:MAG: acylneuraminate cytidylyltransferase family protein [Rheinheimera sp.]|nr:acylneuraminate cytidylyltransferase family protein [Rheinheimera sp.]